MGGLDREAFVGQAAQCLPDRRTADVERLGELALAQPGGRGEHAVEDRLAHGQGDVVGRPAADGVLLDVCPQALDGSPRARAVAVLGWSLVHSRTVGEPTDRPQREYNPGPYCMQPECEDQAWRE